MADLLFYAFLSGFLVSVAPGLVNLIAFEKVLNTSFRAAWAVALGGTVGQGIFVTAVIALYVFSGDAQYVQLILGQVEGIVATAKEYGSLAGIIAGLLVMLAGVYYLRKKGKEREYTTAGFIVGLLLTLGSLDYMLTYATIFGMKTGGIISFAEGVFIILATVLGIHLCWLGKISLVQVLKNFLIRHNWTDFNRITGWALIVVGVPLLLWGLFTG